MASIDNYIQARSVSILSRCLKACSGKASCSGSAVACTSGANCSGDLVTGAVCEAMPHLMVALLDRDETGATAEAIAQLAKVCAVQGTAPSEALSFLGRLREALCVELDERPGVPFSTQEFALLWQRLDGLMLRMFDAYTASRDELAAIRAEEIRRMQGFAVKRVMT